jgi:hypothetical protein
MNFASSDFWLRYSALPDSVRTLADEKYALFEANPRHPSLKFKRVGEYWSVRVGDHYRAVAVDVEKGLLWIWIGSHAEYDGFIRS